MSLLYQYLEHICSTNGATAINRNEDKYMLVFQPIS